MMLLKSFFRLSQMKYNFKIVPVCINYERLFDASYLANEMISGSFHNINMMELVKNIFQMQKGKLGKCFVNYCDPIDLNAYIDKFS